MKRIKKKLGKVLLSLTMVFVMISAMMPINVFATESANVPTVATTIDNSNIIIDGNNGYTIDSHGITKAFNDIADGGTITLGRNVRMQMGAFQLRGSKSISLDLNGYTIDYSRETSLISLFDTYDLTIKDTKTGGTIINNEDGIIYLGDDSSLTIESGTVISSAELKPTIVNNSTGDVKIKGGTIENAVSEDGIGATAILNQSTGNVIIEGGLIKATASYMCTGIQNTGNGSIIISGGIIKAENGSISNNAIDNMSAGQVKVSGGNIISSMKAYSKKGTEDITIDGGNFIGTIDITPKNSANVPVYLTTIVLEDVLADTEISSITGANGYNVNGIKTYTDGKIQLWLPESTTITAISTLTNNYTGTVTTNTSGTASGTFTEAVDLPDYTGTEAGAPSSTPTSKTDTSITLTSIVVSGETIEYAKSTSSVAPTADSDWQTSAIFTGLTANTEYYFFARVKANTSHKVGAVSTGTMIKTDKSNLQKINEAKPLAQSAINALMASNSTTSGNILDAVITGIASVDGVSASWKSAPTSTLATKANAGSITGTIVLTCGSETVEVAVNKTIAQLPNTDKDKVDEAKPLAQSAINALIASNSTTSGNILDAVITGIASVDGVSASWKSAPTSTLATKANAGSITGTIVLTCGSETVEVAVNKTIAQLPITDKDKVDEAKPLAQSAINALIASNSTTSGNILDAVTTGIASVDGVSASWKFAPTITLATKANAGSITGTIVLTCGSEIVEVAVNKTIAQLPITDKDKVDEAKPLAQSAINALIASNSTTAGNILDAVITGISSVDGVSASWKSTPTITPATKENAGSITGIIVLTCGSDTVEVTVDKMIGKLTTPTPEKPEITAGAGSTHQISNGKDMTLTCSGKLEDLTGVYVDGKLVDENNYTLTSGSTILTLKSSYLDTLSAGKHTLKFQYKDSVSAETDFTITAKAGEAPVEPSSPQTGDTSNTTLYFGLIILSGCLAGLGFKKKKILSRIK